MGRVVIIKKKRKTHVAGKGMDGWAPRKSYGYDSEDQKGAMYNLAILSKRLHELVVQNRGNGFFNGYDAWELRCGVRYACRVIFHEYVPTGDFRAIASLDQTQEGLWQLFQIVQNGALGARRYRMKKQGGVA